MVNNKEEIMAKGRNRKKQKELELKQSFEEIEKDQELHHTEELAVLKQHKSRSKASFTREKNSLNILLEEDLPSRRKVREVCNKLSCLQENVIADLVKLSNVYQKSKDSKKVKNILDEMEYIEEMFQTVQQRADEYLDERKYEQSSVLSGRSQRKKEVQEEQLKSEQQAKKLEEELAHYEEEYNSITQKLQHEMDEKRAALVKTREEIIQRRKDVDEEVKKELEYDTEDKGNIKVLNYLRTLDQEEKAPEHKINKERKTGEGDSIQQHKIGQDLWKQLKRVSIPVFTGDKRNYEAWKAAFMACVDKAPTSSEYKLLQLRQYLGGEALKVIESLGHSAAAYDAAKERLERKYGGKRRQIALCLEELESFHPIRNGNAKDMKKFADLLDIAVINLKEAERTEEFSNGTLYTKLQKKIPES